VPIPVWQADRAVVRFPNESFLDRVEGKCRRPIGASGKSCMSRGTGRVLSTVLSERSLSWSRKAEIETIFAVIIVKQVRVLSCAGTRCGAPVSLDASRQLPSARRRPVSV
jgi:hypothetical protein